MGASRWAGPAYTHAHLSSPPRSSRYAERLAGSSARCACAALPSDATRELAYRLILQEVPPRSAARACPVCRLRCDSACLYLSPSPARPALSLRVGGRHRRGPAYDVPGRIPGTYMLASTNSRLRPCRETPARAGPAAAYISGSVKTLEPQPEPGAHDTARQLAPSAVEDQHRRR